MEGSQVPPWPQPHTQGHTGNTTQVTVGVQSTTLCYLQGHTYVMFMVAEICITSRSWAHSR